MVTTTPVDRGASYSIRIFHAAFEIFAFYSRSLGPGVRYIMYPINPTNPSNIEITIATNTIIRPHLRSLAGTRTCSWESRSTAIQHLPELARKD